MQRKTLHLLLAGLLFGLFSCNENSSKVITLESLLDEMISVEELARFPEPYYKSLQESSYDRRSISPDLPGWFANDDGFGIICVDTVKGRIEKVMFDEAGPGVITRIWITTIDKRGTWRFYFDGSETPGLTIPAYDLMQLDVPGVGLGLIQPHTSYEPEGKGGNTSFLPIPYAKSCKITFEDLPGINPTPKYYHINYRKYPQNVVIETYSNEVSKRAEKKIAEVDNILLNPVVNKSGNMVEEKKQLAPADTLKLILPEGENAVYEITFNINPTNASDYEQMMRELIFVAEFDEKQTIWVPLSDFSAGGMGAPYVESWYLSADGKGKVTSRWLMPYKQYGILKLVNASSQSVEANLNVTISPLKWDDRSLYFHASWRQENGIYIHNKPEEADKVIEWNFATIKGKGLYKGDLLSLYNHAPRWYGEGDEKIWVDDDIFPSHFGTGTEDYYNSSWAPVVPFHTPFGGAPRADLESSHGYNAFFRTRNLDGIPFKKDFKFDIEMIGWDAGYADYATTTYWYGDYNAKAYGTSGIEEAKRSLMIPPPNPADYKIPGSIEFEELTPTAKSPELRLEKQSMQGFPDGQWSRAVHLLGKNGSPDDYVEFTFPNLKENNYKLVVYATHASDYGIITFFVNDTPTHVDFDGYGEKVTNSEPIILGIFQPQSETITLKILIKDTNPKTRGDRYMFGLDCIQLIPQ